MIQPLPTADPVGAIEPHSLYHHLQAVTDPRKKLGVRYSVALILTLIILAKLAGETTLSGTAQWVRLRNTWLADQLQLSRRTFPCAATYSNVLKRLDAAEVTRLIEECLTRQASPRKPRRGDHRGSVSGPSAADPACRSRGQNPARHPRPVAGKADCLASVVNV